MRRRVFAAAILPFSLSSSLIGTLSSQEIEQRLRWKEIAPIDSAVAHERVRSREGVIDDLLAPSFDPYLGKRTLPEVCDPKRLPGRKTSEDSTGFQITRSLYSSDNLVLGLCADTAHLMKTQYLFLYCSKSKRLFFIQYFYDPKKPWITDPVAKC